MLPGAALGRFRAVFCTIPVRFVSAVALVAPRQQPPPSDVQVCVTD